MSYHRLINSWSDLLSFFCARFQMLEPGDCWVYTGSKDTRGYGRIASALFGTIKAHRLSWMAQHGEIPDGLDILHKCNNPPCVNFNHLYAGIDLQNARDRKQSGRNNSCVGSSHGRSKLTESDVVKIRELYAGGVTQIAIGKQFGIHQAMASLICRRKNWKHV